MGNPWSTFIGYCPERLVKTLSDRYYRKRKLDTITDGEQELLNVLNSPKRRKLASTTRYIYQALFVEGQGSDITVHILEKDWKLHKIYLGQSEYFRSMFCGSWSESDKSYISIEVEDENVTCDALNTVFGSFYLDEVVVDPRLVVGVLATATLFQITGLIEQCGEVMLETVSPPTAAAYFNASCRYGVQKVKDKTLDWFTLNLTDYFPKNPSSLSNISKELMELILKQKNLVVIPSEMVLYYLLRKWVYLNITKNVDEADRSLESNYFKDRQDKDPFLMSEDGLEFIGVFRALKLSHLLLHLSDIKVIIQDNIIPQAWLSPVFNEQWVMLLHVSSGHDKGPVEVDEALFHEHAVRCGRVIHSGDTLSWRWSYFHYGIDLMWSLADKALYVMRHKGSDRAFANNPSIHHFIIQIEAMNFDEKRQCKRQYKSGIQRHSLPKNLETKLLDLSDDFEYPLLVSVKVLITSPPSNLK